MHQQIDLEVLTALEGNDGPEEGKIDEVDSSQLFGPGVGGLKGIAAGNLQQRQNHHRDHEEGGDGLECEIDPLLEAHRFTLPACGSEPLTRESRFADLVPSFQ